MLAEYALLLRGFGSRQLLSCFAIRLQLWFAAADGECGDEMAELLEGSPGVQPAQHGRERRRRYEQTQEQDDPTDADCEGRIGDIDAGGADPFNE
jgi:hypothetical protein